MSHFGIARTRSGRRMPRTAVVVTALVLSLFAQSLLADNGTPPLNFFNNYFVTGDYVVGGVGLRGLGVNGFATGTISIPDANSVPATGVPAGADIVAAFLYWQTVESGQTLAGQQGFFNGYPITGAVLGNPNAPVSWSLGGCTGSSQGSKTMRTYRADVRPYLKLDANGHIQGVVKLADSGSNGGGVPLTLGASLVVIYRVLSPTLPLNSVVLYDGAYAPGNTTSDLSLDMHGFYEAAAAPVAKITHIVGNGQSNKSESVYLLNDKTNVTVPLPSLYGKQKPPFPGFYNGSWDNPTWVVNNYGPAVNAEDSSETTFVTSSGGCPSWGAVIFSSTVQNTDNDGLLNTWKTNQGYTDVKDGSFVALPGAILGQKDLFIQADSMCSVVKADGTTCDTINGHSHAPDPQAVAMMTSAFTAQGINLHFVTGNVIPESTCTDDYTVSPPKLCPYPGQPGVVGWKGGFEFLKNQPLNIDPNTGKIFDEAGCEANPGTCIRRFQHGRKDSYHYALFGHSLGLANWTLQDGSLVSLTVANNIATLTTLYPHGLTAGTDRFTISDEISSPNLSGTYFVQNVMSPTSFTIQTTNVAAGSYSKTTDPSLSVSKGTAGTTSGYSDIGGADSAITLGGWGADGKPVNVQAGTFMHELGHTLTLTHGGLYFDTAGSSVGTIEPNCKPNFQSVMNYLFQVDLLGPNNVLDYSTQELTALNESGGSPADVLGNALYSTTSWFAPNQPVGTAATHHCDGSPLLPSDPPTFRIDGPSASMQWFAGQDINFDGVPNSSTASSPVHGFNDWAHLDLRQIGATGSNIPGAGIFGVGGGIFGVGGGIFGVGGGIFGVGGGIFGVGGGIFGVGGGIFGVGGGIFGVGGGLGNGDLTVESANSVVRPPRTLTDTPNDTRTSHSATLNWNFPSFGTIGSYNIYRGANGATPALFYPPNPLNGAPLVTTTSYLNSAVTDCTTYAYFVSSILAADGRESVPSNSVQYAVPCLPTGLQAAQSVVNNAGAVTLNWTAASTASGANLGYKVYRVADTDTTNMTLLTSTPVAAVNYTDSTVANHTTYTYAVTTVPVDQSSCQGANHYCRESTQAIVRITVSFKLPQTITFAQLPDKTYGNPDFTVSATASSGLPVSFTASPSSNCTVSGTTVHIVHAGACTVTASQAGNDNYYPAPDVPNAFTIKKANATIGVTGYSVTYDGNQHTATGTATGVFNEGLSGLDLSGTRNTNAGAYNDSWIFTDVTGNYNNANGAVADSIARANPTIVVVPYSVTYDGNAHTATGSATGVKGEALSGLNLTGTTHTVAGTYSSDAWTFTDVTGNYNNAGGAITDSIIRGNSTTTITSISPSPSILGQSFTVNFTVSHVSGIGTPTGNVTVSDVLGASCTGALTAGAGKCVLTLPTVNNGKPVVGTRALTATYAGDANFTASAGVRNQQVIYTFTGFYSPLSPAGDSSNSGSYNIGKSVTAKWNLQDNSGNYLGYLNSNALYAVGPVPPVNGKCPLPGQVPVLLGSTGYPYTVTTLYSPTTGAKGNSTFRISSSNNQFIFNWDTTGFTAGCYVLELDLDSGQAERTTLKLQ